MRPSESAWRELVDRLLDSAEERPGGYKKLYFMEKMGFQDHTVRSYFSIISVLKIMFDWRLTIFQTRETSGGGSLGQISTSHLMGSQTLIQYTLCNVFLVFIYVLICSYKGSLHYQLSSLLPRTGSFCHSDSRPVMILKPLSLLLLLLSGISGPSCWPVQCSSVDPTRTWSGSESINILL